MIYDAIIIGGGPAGLASALYLLRDGRKVLIIEKREHIGGNMYDYVDETGIITHQP